MAEEAGRRLNLVFYVEPCHSFCSCLRGQGVGKGMQLADVRLSFTLPAEDRCRPRAPSASLGFTSLGKQQWQPLGREVWKLPPACSGVISHNRWEARGASQSSDLSRTHPITLPSPNRERGHPHLPKGWKVTAGHELTSARTSSH